MAERPTCTLDARLAAELDVARRTLEDLAVGLCLDPIVFERHSEPLQRFDQLAQVFGEVAGVLRRKGSADEAIGAIRLEALRERLTAAATHTRD